ncbi:hypothetical protein F5884DRAFT_747023 [Xylogone sp. PMI_703]|nr:hypothetical protein F5884DRAFT_747023 [Xylogone sp. PMI_703]
MGGSSTELPEGGGLPEEVHITFSVKKIIDMMDGEDLRFEFHHLIKNYPVIVGALAIHLMVQGKDIESERKTHSSCEQEHGDECGEEEEEEEEEKQEDDSNRPLLLKQKVEAPKPVCLGDKEYALRYSECENCGKSFDVTWNWRGACVWHPVPNVFKGQKQSRDSHSWKRPYGPHEFFWNCCNEPGDTPGCMNTKHKADINRVVSAPLSPSPPPALPLPKARKKRKAEEEMINLQEKAVAKKKANSKGGAKEAAPQKKDTAERRSSAKKKVAIEKETTKRRSTRRKAAS